MYTPVYFRSIYVIEVHLLDMSLELRPMKEISTLMVTFSFGEVLEVSWTGESQILSARKELGFRGHYCS